MKRGDELRVADVVRDAAASRGDHVAIRHRDLELTYAELDERSNRLAQALRAAGVGMGSRVAHLDRTAPEIVELLFATSKLGAVTVPLNWRLSPAELAAVVADAPPGVLAAGEAYADVAAPNVVVVGPEYERWLAAHEPIDPGGRGESNDTVLQLYTSGTTGVPKGVLTTNRNLAAAAESSPLWEFDADTISMTPLPMFHIGGIGWAFLGLWNAATTVLVSEFVPEDVLDVLERQRVTNTIFVPTMLQLLCAVPGAGERDYSALRSIAYGASPITTPVLKDALRTFRCSLYGVYGLTESTGGVMQLDPSDHDTGGRAPAPSAGRPFPWVELRIVDRPLRRRGRRGVAPRAERDARLLQPARGDRGRADRGRLAAHRRRRLPRRRGLPVPHRPDQGHDRQRRRERVPDRGRGGALAAPGRRRGRRDRRARRALGRGGEGGRRRALGKRRRQPTSWSRSRASGSPATSCRARSSSSTELPRTPSGKVLKRELRERAVTLYSHPG